MDQPQASSESQPTSPTPASAPEPLVAPEKKRGPSTLTVILVAIIIVLAAVLAAQTFHLFGGPAPSSGPSVVSIASSAPTATAGQPLQFTLTNLQAGQTAIVHMGDGSVLRETNASFSYPYATGGTYLVWLQVEASNGTVVQDYAGSLLRVSILPDVPNSLAQYVSVPTIYFNTTKNPNPPFTTPTTTLYLYGNFTQVAQLYASSAAFLNLTSRAYNNVTTAVSIADYRWDFGNGLTSSVAASTADSSNPFPVANPVTTSYSTSGLYLVSLSIDTVEQVTSTITVLGRNGFSFTNTTTVNSFSESIGYTIAVGSNFGLSKYKGTVPSPGVLTEIVNFPGGPFSFDPQVDYESVGYEVILNTQAVLLFYQGNSTSQWFPYAATSVPTVGNGISTDLKNYSFTIRPDMRFSNGDPLTAYDVWYSTIRTELFQGGVPGTPGWIVTQYLLPTYSYAPFTSVMSSDPTTWQASYKDVMGTVSYSNTSDTVTFHLWRPVPPTVFFTAVSDTLGMGIMDSSWLQRVGAGITFSPLGFYEYQNQSIEGNYNSIVQFHPPSAGPYAINTYVPSTSVVLTPNPFFPSIAQIPKQNRTVVIEWVSSPSVAYQLFASGEGDIVTNLPPPFFQTIRQNLIPANQAKIQGPSSTTTEYFEVYNLQVNTTILSSLFPGASIPSDYFANPLVREAFAYAFNYTQYINNIVGNARYGYNFGNLYCGVIVKGLPFYVPPQDLAGCPDYDLAMAKSLLYKSGMYNTSVNFPFFVQNGLSQEFSAGKMWADALAAIDPNIKMTPTYINFVTEITYQIPHGNPMPVYQLAWIADYPYPSDYTDAMYLQGGTYPIGTGFNETYLKSLATAHPTQSALYTSQYRNYTALNQLIRAADLAVNTTQAAQLYKQVEQVAVKLYMFVYTYQQNLLWAIKPWIQPYQNDWGYQTSPLIGAGQDSCFFWWTKG